MVTLTEAVLDLCEVCLAFEAWVLRYVGAQSSLKECFLFQGILGRQTLLEKTPETPFDEASILRWLNDTGFAGADITVSMVPAAKPLISARVTILQTGIASNEMFGLQKSLVEGGYQREPQSQHIPSLAVWFAKNGYRYRSSS